MDDSGPEIEISYSEASPFVRLFQTEGQVRIVDVFLRKQYKALTTREIAEFAGIDRSTVSRNLSVLQDIGLIIDADKVGNAPRYQTNTEHPVIKSLEEAQYELFKYGGEIAVSGTSDDGNVRTGDLPKETTGDANDISNVISLLNSEDEELRDNVAEILLEHSRKNPQEFSNYLPVIMDILDERPEVVEDVAKMVRNISTENPEAVSKAMISKLLELGMMEPAENAKLAEAQPDDGPDDG